MWTIITTERFDRWFQKQDNSTQEKILAGLYLLQQGGPRVSRPYVDTINGSVHRNMKELRIQHKGVPIRALFAFDPRRQAMVLCTGHKGENPKRFYTEMLPVADDEFTKHLNTLERP
ncbi:type II toxin-antitoxin system RelE/ParE family toxin [Budviciaceae bacterium BWR-B9]|uniref:Type II toxin-antitoxin system RelE/ParE family toxin n=1 Tax=Limnobaculum allomyrinae TaxID=2791986 RepID=A0ABS1INE0_9GAMM|nr:MULTISPECIES: type II toxin-antitoxin system RelE/ParE family toxin [Limnobaculum]MBK5143271.1 type II toxin-antitoxin system RelE/ParE family toxin [Limnobaculum allomyrinae]MBV7691159.1 type II toxin-antitoxin system RelE/ParE family toxin [Limnobaculum sp. M2-1]